jgi:hypothetical protein
MAEASSVFRRTNEQRETRTIVIRVIGRTASCGLLYKECPFCRFTSGSPGLTALFRHVQEDHLAVRCVLSLNAVEDDQQKTREHLLYPELSGCSLTDWTIRTNQEIAAKMFRTRDRISIVLLEAKVGPRLLVFCPLCTAIASSPQKMLEHVYKSHVVFEVRPLSPPRLDPHVAARPGDDSRDNWRAKELFRRMAPTF